MSSTFGDLQENSLEEPFSWLTGKGGSLALAVVSGINAVPQTPIETPRRAGKASVPLATGLGPGKQYGHGTSHSTPDWALLATGQTGMTNHERQLLMCLRIDMASRERCLCVNRPIIRQTVCSKTG